MFLDGATVRSSLRSGVDASPSLCDERRLAVTSGAQRGTIGSALPRNRGNPLSSTPSCLRRQASHFSWYACGEAARKAKSFRLPSAAELFISCPCRTHFPNDPLPPLPPLTPASLTPHLVMPAKADTAPCAPRTLASSCLRRQAPHFKLVRLQRSLRAEQELSPSFGGRVTFSLHGHEHV